MDIRILIFLFLLSLMTSSFALENKTTSPAGRWLTFDDQTHQKTGLIEIYEHKGIYYGKIVEGYGKDRIEYCTNCEGPLKNKPVAGMTFMWGFVPYSNKTWSNGRILDPRSGNVYRGSFALSNNGKELQLRGYWGVFWKTQTWARSQ